jgi:hypothetical protein
VFRSRARQNNDLASAFCTCICMIYHVYITDVMGTSQTVEQQTTLAPEETAPETLGPEKLTDIDAVRDYLMGLVSQGQSAQAIEMLLDLLLRMRDSHTAVSVRLQNALRQLYGRKSETVCLSRPVGAVFGTAGQLCQAS